MMFSEDKDAGSQIGRYLTPFLYASLGVALIVGLFGEELLWFLVPPSYFDAIPIVSILAIYYGILFFGKIPNMLYARKTLIISIFNVVGMVVNIVVTIPFVHYYGAVGAAWSTILPRQSPRPANRATPDAWEQLRECRSSKEWRPAACRSAIAKCGSPRLGP